MSPIIIDILRNDWIAVGYVRSQNTTMTPISRPKHL